ncbi:MAG: 23S rRNA (pseudouridine(1915)-N(3))-methyltransferase RlmH [Pseudomonadota bacterium]
MRLTIVAVGRLRRGPLSELFEDFQMRVDRTGAQRGLGPLSVIEVEDKTGQGTQAEAALLSRALPKDAHIIALDERGKTPTSPRFAQQIETLRDRGIANCVFLIGGADGLAPDLRDAAHSRLSFGPMVWPHMLARVMLAEQLYRATAILTGAPYHRA